MLYRSDEVPNQELARDLAATKDRQGIQAVAENLWNKDQNVQSDCLKVLYEIGYLAPELIADFADDFLKLLRHKNNRMVCGSMIALSTIAELKADDIYAHYDDIVRVMAQGSVITVNNGVKTLALVASRSDDRREKILPYLLNHLATCRLKDVPQHAEKIVVAVDAKTRDEFVGALEKRMAGMTCAPAVRLKRVIKEAEKRCRIHA